MSNNTEEEDILKLPSTYESVCRLICIYKERVSQLQKQNDLLSEDVQTLRGLLYRFVPSNITSNISYPPNSHGLIKDLVIADIGSQSFRPNHIKD